MAKLLADNPYVDFVASEYTSASVTKAVTMNSMPDISPYAVRLGEFSEVAGVKHAAFVTCKKNVIIIKFPGGNPLVNLKRGLGVDTDNPSLVSLTVLYDDGSCYRIDVCNPKTDDFDSSELGAEGQ